LRPRAPMGERGANRDLAGLIRSAIQSPIQSAVQSAVQSAICNLNSAFQVALDPVLSVLLAASCAACDELLEHPTSGPVCEPCWRSILPLTPPLCDRCGDPL